MKYAIIENEEFARTNLESLIAALRPDWKCVFTAETVADSVDYFSYRPEVDVLFMDIELDDGNCFEIFNEVDIKAPVIFTTAYDEYAVRAFKTNSIDYLLKPIMEEDVAHAIGQFEKSRQSVKNYRKVADEIGGKKRRNRILVNTKDGYSYVLTDDVAWFEAEDKYVFIILKNGKRLMGSGGGLVDIIETLDPDRFFQVSRSVVVSIESISGVYKHFKGRLRVTMEAEAEKREETVSAARRPEFLDWLGQA